MDPDSKEESKGEPLEEEDAYDNSGQALESDIDDIFGSSEEIRTTED